MERYGPLEVNCEAQQRKLDAQIDELQQDESDNKIFHSRGFFFFFGVKSLVGGRLCIMVNLYMKNGCLRFLNSTLLLAFSWYDY